MKYTFPFLFISIVFTACSRKSTMSLDNYDFTEEEVKQVQAPKIEDSLQLERVLKDSLDKIEEGGTESADADSTDLYYNPEFLRNKDHVYKKGIHTVKMYRSDDVLSDPIIELNGSSTLTFTFDEMSSDYNEYYYTITHHNSNWERSILEPFQFLDGFEENTIRDVKFSFNTIQKYIHYRITLPNDDIKLTKSGNYLIKVYKDGESDRPVITKKFMVVEQQAGISADLRAATFVEFKRSHHEIDFTIDYTGMEVNNPFDDLKVVVVQNNRWDNAIAGLQPTFVRDKSLVFDYTRKNIFKAGKEFRYFNISSLRQRSEFVERITDSILTPHVFLFPEEPRSFAKYMFRKDVNGKFVVKKMDRNEPEIEADYVFVHFKFNVEQVLTSGDVYILGEFTNWDLDEQFKMKYNYEKRQYEASAFLKQGYYNYMYVIAEDGATEFDLTITEGNYYETENDYTIYVYKKAFNDSFEELVGVKTFNSLRR